VGQAKARGSLFNVETITFYLKCIEDRVERRANRKAELNQGSGNVLVRIRERFLLLLEFK
jgi:hypothetical protein